MDLYTPGSRWPWRGSPSFTAKPTGGARPAPSLTGEETRLRHTGMCAYAARRYALWALGSSGAAILLAAVALFTR
jgi:hypothetical protein